MAIDPRQDDSCCQEFDDAQDIGTDHEGYGSAVSYDSAVDEYSIGVDTPAINYCPWCGKEIGK